MRRFFISSVSAITCLLCLSSLTSCNMAILTEEEYQQTKGVLKSQSDVYIDQEPLFDKDSNSIEWEYRIFTHYIESPSDWENDYIQYGNVIDSYWVCKSLFNIKKTLAKTTIINSRSTHPDLWEAVRVKIKPQPY